MKRYGLTLATLLISFSMPLVSKDSSSMTEDTMPQPSKNRSIKFINDDEMSGVKLTITDKTTGTPTTMRLSSKESFVSNWPLVGATKSMRADGGSFKIQAEETSGKTPLKTTTWNLRLRAQNDTGTVHIVRTSALTGGGDMLIFVGDEEGQGGAHVREEVFKKNKKNGKRSGSKSGQGSQSNN